MRPGLLSRPGSEPDAATRAEFDALLAVAMTAGPGTAIDYRLAAPKWQFLCHVADRGEAVLHGSSDPDIDRFEPRQSNDIAEFGNRTAVYAAADGLWAMYFAILDRPRHRCRWSTAASGWSPRTGRWAAPYYFFSVDSDSLEHGQFSPGTVYLLPAGRFEREADHLEGGLTVRTAHAACLQPVEPLAKLAVEPADFPLPIRGHDVATLRARIEADPDGFPWLAADEL